MGIAPPPSLPPRKPQDRNMVWAAVLIVGFIIASAIVMVWFGLRILSHGVHVKVTESTPDSKVVTVKTPVGDIRIAKEENISDLRLGLPIYPVATRERVTSDDNSVSVSFSLPQQVSLRVAVAKFDTPDSIDKVEEFYKQQLGGEVTSFTQTNRDGKVVFEIKYGDQHKVVSLQPRNRGTHISLVRIFKGHDEPN